MSTRSTTITPFSTRKQRSDDNKIKQMSVIGIVSIAAVVHSHLYWVYSIIYIAYHKITPNDEIPSPSTIKWRTNKFENDLNNTLITSNKKKKVHRHHSRKKSLTAKPKSVIMPTIAPTKVAMITSGTNTVDALLSSAPKQHRIPLLNALRTFPSSNTTAKQHQNSFNIHQLIKSQRKLPKRSSSTGQLNKVNSSSLSTLIEAEGRKSEDSYSSSNGSCSGAESLPTHYQTTSKKSRAMGLLRSTFQRSVSTDAMIHKSSSFSSLSEDENIVVIAATTKKRNRDAIFGLTRKFSSRKNLKEEEQTCSETSLLNEQQQQQQQSSAVEDIKKQQRKKLFRSLPSWKKEK